MRAVRRKDPRGAVVAAERDPLATEPVQCLHLAAREFLRVQRAKPTVRVRRKRVARRRRRLGLRHGGDASSRGQRPCGSRRSLRGVLFRRRFGCAGREPDGPRRSPAARYAGRWGSARCRGEREPDGSRRSPAARDAGNRMSARICSELHCRVAAREVEHPVASLLRGAAQRARGVACPQEAGRFVQPGSRSAEEHPARRVHRLDLAARRHATRTDDVPPDAESTNPPRSARFRRTRHPARTSMRARWSSPLACGSLRGKRAGSSRSCDEIHWRGFRFAIRAVARCVRHGMMRVIQGDESCAAGRVSSRCCSLVRSSPSRFPPAPVRATVLRRPLRAAPTRRASSR